MKAAVLTEPGQPLAILPGIEVPDLGPGQVLVRIAYSGVCHSQLMEARGRRGEDPWLPHLLGHEGSGKVVAVGEAVTKVAPGDYVILGWIKGAGADGGGTRYHRDGTIINAGGVTTFNEQAVVSENRLVRLPAGLPLDIAVLFGCAVPTGAGILTNEIRPEPGSTIAFFGLGGIGLSALMASALFDCKRVIAVDVSDQKLELAGSFGADVTINSKSCDPVAEILRITDGRGVDYSIEASGVCAVIESAFEVVRAGGGLCVFASHPKHGDRISLDPFALISGRQIRGSWGGRSNPDTDIPRFAELYAEGFLPLEKLITRRYKLEEINTALDDLEAGRVGRPLIEIDPDL
ncbi:MAG: zinc-binding dehydrogenase [Rhodospirillales bacterium]|nr:MAG: zinc-binding dehydrogenase [Rhodospirillales bacterium]